MEVEETILIDASAELLQFHQKYGHISPLKIKAMAKRGIIPKRLTTCPVPVCTACLYDKATNKPWRSKASDKEREAQHPISRPGECGSQLT